MNNDVKPDQLLELSMKWDIPFRELLDQIYWSGYAEWLLKENLEGYQTEYYYFIALYDEPPPTLNAEIFVIILEEIYFDDYPELIQEEESKNSALS